MQGFSAELKNNSELNINAEARSAVLSVRSRAWQAQRWRFDSAASWGPSAILIVSDSTLNGFRARRGAERAGP